MASPRPSVLRHTLPFPRLGRALHRCAGLFRCRPEPLLLAIVIPLEPAAANLATRHRFEIHDALGANAGLDGSPHVSLKLGFHAPDLDAVTAFVGKLAASVRPFTIRIEDFGFFDEGICFIGVHGCSALKSLRQRLLLDLKEEFGVNPHPIEGDEFRFHVTLAHGLGAGEMAKLRAMFGNRHFHLEAPVRSIDLFVFVNGHWETYHRASVGSATDADPSRSPAIATSC